MLAYLRRNGGMMTSWVSKVNRTKPITSWADHIKKQRPLYYLTSKTDQPQDRSAYYFLLVIPHKERLFKKAIDEKDSLNLTDYGEIVASGWGEPNEFVKQRMFEQYGWKASS